MDPGFIWFDLTARFIASLFCNLEEWACGFYAMSGHVILGIPAVFQACQVWARHTSRFADGDHVFGFNGGSGAHFSDVLLWWGGG